MRLVIWRSVLCREEGADGLEASLDVDLPFLPEVGSQIFDPIAGAPVAVRRVERSPGHVSKPSSILLDPLFLDTEYEVQQWIKQYQAGGWRIDRSTADISLGAG